MLLLGRLRTRHGQARRRRAAPGRSRTSAGASAASSGPAASTSSPSPLWLLLLVPGWIAWALISLWFLYRIVARLAEPVVEHADAEPEDGRDERATRAASSASIVAGEIPSRKAYEDDELLVFHDIAPWAPVHVLIIPKEHIATFYDVTDAHTALLGRMLALAPRLMRELGVTNGFRTLVNTGPDGVPGGAAPPHARHGRSASLGEGLT